MFSHGDAYEQTRTLAYFETGEMLRLDWSQSISSIRGLPRRSLGEGGRLAQW